MALRNGEQRSSRRSLEEWRAGQSAVPTVDSRGLSVPA